MDKATIKQDLEDLKTIIGDLEGIVDLLSDDDIETLQHVKDTSTWGKIKLVGHLLTDASAAKEYFGGMLIAAKSLKFS